MTERRAEVLQVIDCGCRVEHSYGGFVQKIIHDPRHSPENVEKLVIQMGLLITWEGIARARGIRAADEEMHDNFNGWNTLDAISERTRIALLKP